MGKRWYDLIPTGDFSISWRMRWTEIWKYPFPLLTTMGRLAGFQRDFHFVVCQKCRNYTFKAYFKGLLWKQITWRVISKQRTIILLCFHLNHERKAQKVKEQAVFFIYKKNFIEHLPTKYKLNIVTNMSVYTYMLKYIYIYEVYSFLFTDILKGSFCPF